MTFTDVNHRASMCLVIFKFALVVSHCTSYSNDDLTYDVVRKSQTVTNILRSGQRSERATPLFRIRVRTRMYLESELGSFKCQQS